MHSLRGWNWLVLGSVMGMVHGAALPTITPAPRPDRVDIRSLKYRQDPDAIEILQVLITALPLSLRQIAATNIPAVSSILWEEFLDDNRPEWFNELPYDIQSYFIQEFGPATAAPPASEAIPTDVTASCGGIFYNIRIRKLEHNTYIYGVFKESLERDIQFGVFLRVFSRIFDYASDFVIFRDYVFHFVLVVKFIRDSKFNCRPNSTCVQRLWPNKTKRRRSIEGSQPPSSPGFIPRFSFQDRGLSVESFEHRRPLNPASHQTSRFVEDMNWEDDGYEPPMSTAYGGHTIPAAAPTPSQANAIATAGVPHPNQGKFMPAGSTPMAMQDNHTPILAPALYHSHSSNRARGRRTSYTSLHSVAEVTEPDDEMNRESPILGRHNSPPRTGPRRPGVPTLDMLPVPAVASIKRKPVPTSPISSPAAEASRGLLRPSLAHNTADHSGSSSSGLAVSSLSSNSGHTYHSDDSAPISPITHQKPSSNPFAGGYSYLEDYGPEYSNNGYNDQDDEVYGGHRSLDRYPDPSPPRRKSSKTEWPLRNVMGGGQKRTRSPMWDRVYERV
ncbi:uncharacterized protein ALTATR162_LOCUS3955 [Alternaria atra]|uniref:Uncharacterized protein n=1 Tax=Alternaria atra TaxID=119953 RepID=A0A8J2MYT0_9PLEO|nr:uncharacterized protein ALTATR162_LOCUS3955 [Alternaria atra]CAG5156039.1 unnamed protein product [Alternaria atra]